MTVLGATRTPVPISAEVRADAVAVIGEESDHTFGQVAVAMADGQQLLLPPSLSHFVIDLIQSVASGATLTVNEIPDELTTTVAAHLIGVSRPTLMKMIARGDLPSKRVGSHTRLSRDAVLSYRERRLAERSRAVRALMESGNDLA